MDLSINAFLETGDRYRFIEIHLGFTVVEVMSPRISYPLQSFILQSPPGVLVLHMGVPVKCVQLLGHDSPLPLGSGGSRNRARHTTGWYVQNG